MAQAIGLVIVLVLLALPVVGVIVGLVNASRLRALREIVHELEAEVRRLKAQAHGIAGTAPRAEPEVPLRPPLPAPPRVAPAPPPLPPLDARPAAAAAPAPSEAPPPRGARASPAAAAPAASEASPVAAAAPAKADGAAPEGFDVERFLGVKFFSWIAGIALVIAAGFFLHYSIQQGWLAPPVRMTLGLAAGIALVVGCELRVAREYAVTANSLLGAGLSILLATLWAAHVRWSLVPMPVAFAGMALVTAAAVALSVRRDSPFVAGLGLVGGFATPVALPGAGEHGVGLFGYLLLLSVGLALLAMRTRWHWVLVASLVATTLHQWRWVGRELDPEKLPLGMAAFVAFPAASVALWLVARRQEAEGEPAFRDVASAAAALPAAFAIFVAATPAHAERPGLTLAFLALVVTGITALGVLLPRPALVALGGVASVAAWYAWLGPGTTRPEHWWPSVALALGGFVALHAFAPVVARALGRPHGGAMTLGALAAPLLILGVMRFVHEAPAGTLVAAVAMLAVVGAAGAWLGDGRVFACAVVAATACLVTWPAGNLPGTPFAPFVAALLGVPALALVVPLLVARARAPWRGEGADVLAGLPVLALGGLLLVPKVHEREPWPWMIGVAALGVLAGAHAVLRGRARALASVAGSSLLAIAPWGVTSPAAPAGLSGLALALVVAGACVVASRLVPEAAGELEQVRVSRVAAAAVATAALPLLAVSGGADLPSPWAVAAAEVLLVLAACALGLQRHPKLPLVMAGVSWLPLLAWETSSRGDRGVELAAGALALHATFVAWTLALGRRVGSRSELHVATAASALPAFLLARHGIIQAGLQDGLGLLAVLQAVVLLGVLAHVVHVERAIGESATRRAAVAGAALAFLTAAIPLQLDREWITVGFALECVALAWLFVARIHHPGLALWCFGLAITVFVRLALNPAVLEYHARSRLAILNWYLYAYGIAAASLLVTARLLERADDGTSESIPRARVLMNAGAGVLLFLLLNIEIADFWSTGPTLTFHFTAGLAPDLTYTLGWAVFAIGLLVVGIAAASRGARIASIGLLLVVVLKAFLHDLMRLGGLYRVGAFLGLAISLALVAVLFQRFVLRRGPGQ